MKAGPRPWRPMARCLSVAALLTLGAAGSQAPLPPALGVTDALAQATPPAAKPPATPDEAKPDAPKSDKPKPQTAQEADQRALALVDHQVLHRQLFEQAVGVVGQAAGDAAGVDALGIAPVTDDGG